MCRAHAVPASIKAANLARWFPPWTVSRERWSTILRSSFSGIVTDALMFSWIGVPLVHRYRVFARAGTHVAFRGTYMARLRNFLNAADAACLKSCKRHRALSLASQMSPEVQVGAAVGSQLMYLSPVRLVARPWYLSWLLLLLRSLRHLTWFVLAGPVARPSLFCLISRYLILLFRIFRRGVFRRCGYVDMTLVGTWIWLHHPRAHRLRSALV